MTFAIEHTITALRERVEEALDSRLPSAEQAPEPLHAAMRYAVLGGGKRIRPILAYSAGAAVRAEPDSLDAAAVAVELIHAYSLVHDDLPAMDNDDLRRGRPTCHKAFDEATAILTGDALQALAFQVLADESRVPVANRLRQVRILAEACGSQGMAGGQAMDLASVGRTSDVDALQAINRLKTGALIRASVMLGALARPDVDDDALSRLKRYGECLGEAFQIQDDILDITGDTATLGKTRGSDQARDKPTYPGLLGLDRARQRALALCEEACAQLQPFAERSAVLVWLADFIVQRRH